MQQRLANYFSSQENNRIWQVENGFYAFRIEDRFGVFMISRQPDDEEWYDSLNDMSLEINKPVFLSQDQEKKGIFFSCSNEGLRERFAEQCCNLYNNRERFLTDPKQWWNDLKELTGDKIESISTSEFFAEFVTWLYLVKTYPDKKTVWQSCRGSHDIQSDDGTQHEVKSSDRQRNTAIIHLANNLQGLSGNAPLFFYFCRIDKDRDDGLSINDLIAIATRLNCDMNAIEKILSAQKIMPNTDERREQFFIMDFWRYDGNDPRFPKITWDSFKDNVNTDALAAFKYSINLDALTDLREVLTEQLKEVLSLR